jgi:hypothetical protein
MYYRHGGGDKQKDKGNSRARWCKNMALMKVGSVITIPKRQFMGESKTLMADLNDMFAEEIVRIFQNTPQTP